MLHVAGFVTVCEAFVGMESHVHPEQRPTSWEQGGRKAPPDLARVEELVADLAVEELVASPRD